MARRSIVTKDDAMRILKVSPEEGYLVHLQFDDGTSGVVDLSDIAGQGVFAAWCQSDAFFNLEIGSAGELSWACGVDLCADSLYLRLTGKHAKDIFPVLAGEVRCA
jgi:hypothetical protein